MARPETNLHEIVPILLVDTNELYDGDIPVLEKGFYWDKGKLKLYKSIVPMFSGLVPHNCKQHGNIFPDTQAEWRPLRLSDKDGNRLGEIVLSRKCLHSGKEFTEILEERMVKPSTLEIFEGTKFETI